MKKINFKIPKLNISKLISFSDFIVLSITVIFALMTFVGRDITSYYGSELARGFGVMCLAVAWLLNINSKKLDISKNYIIKQTIAISFLVISMTLLASLASFVTISIYILFISTLALLKYYKVM